MLRLDNSSRLPVSERSVKVVVIGLLDDDVVGLSGNMLRGGLGSLDDVCRGRSGSGGGEPLELVDADSSGGGNDGLDNGGMNGRGMSSDNGGGGKPLVLVVDADGSGGGHDGLDDGGGLDYPSGVVRAGGLNKVSGCALVVGTILVVLAFETSLVVLAS